MDEILLSELIERTNEAIRPLEHSPSTVYQYQMAWQALKDYFAEHDQVMFSKPLAEQFIQESKVKLDVGLIKRWRYKLNRLAVLILIEYFESGQVTWKFHKDRSQDLHQAAYILLHTDYLHCLEEEGKGFGTLRIYETISRQFLQYLEQRGAREIAEVRLNEVSSFIPFISMKYQSTSMRTVLSALRSFLRFVEDRNFTGSRLSSAIPPSLGRKVSIVRTLSAEEEQKLLDSTDRTTALGKRNYAMLLLALRTGLRSVDILNLKLGDIHWKDNLIEIVQKKTGVALVLPLLADVGNAIADYILNGRPESSLVYIFLRSQAPYRKLSEHSGCYGISKSMMKKAGIRQRKGEPNGFHCLRHSLAARLLAEETPLPVISSILGHRNKDSTQVYLSTDLEHLRTCALSLTGIEVFREVLR